MGLFGIGTLLRLLGSVIISLVGVMLQLVQDCLASVAMWLFIDSFLIFLFSVVTCF